MLYELLIFFLSVLALSSRFDGPNSYIPAGRRGCLSVLALSSRFDGRAAPVSIALDDGSFSTRSVESF